MKVYVCLLIDLGVIVDLVKCSHRCESKEDRVRTYVRMYMHECTMMC